MFRPTHFVILFAVVLYANAIPVSPSATASEGPSSKGEGGSGDLDTDATTYWRYTHYGPRWGYVPNYEPPRISNRLAAWGFGFGKLYRAVPQYLYPTPIATGTAVIEVN